MRNTPFMYIPVLFALIIIVLWIDVRNLMFCPRFSMDFFLLLHKLLIFSISSLSRSFRMLSDMCICLRNFGDKFCSISEFKTIRVEILFFYKKNKYNSKIIKFFDFLNFFNSIDVVDLINFIDFIDFADSSISPISSISTNNSSVSVQRPFIISDYLWICLVA